MILVDFLLNNFLKSVTGKNYQLVFELDDRIYTGTFSPKNGSGIPSTYTYNPGWEYDLNDRTFQPGKAQELRSALFEHVFGKDASVSESMYKQYSDDLQHLILRDVISVISNLDPDSIFADNVDFPEIILNLENMENGTKFDHYIVNDRSFTPVSFIESKNDKWLF